MKQEVDSNFSRLRSCQAFCGLILAALLLTSTAVAAQIRTVLVSPVPGNPLASGTALRNALAGIPSPSAADRWLVKIEPGIYDVGTTSLPMRSFVDVEGSGIEATTIRGSGDASGFQNATLLGADNSELRFLTVQAVGTATSSVIAMANYGASPRLFRIKVLAQAQVAWGLRNSSGAPLLDECEITVTGIGSYGVAYGIVTVGFPPPSRRSSIANSKVTVSGATQNYGIYMENALSITSIRDSHFDVTGGTSTQGLYADGNGWNGNESLTIRNTEISSAGASGTSYGIRFEHGASVTLAIYGSTIWGSVAPTTYGIWTDSTVATAGIQGSSITGFTKTIQFGGNISIQSTLLQGGPTTAGGWLGCMGVWDENAVFYTQGCPP